MLAKVITLKHSARSKGFGPVMDYVMRATEDLPDGLTLEAGHLNVDADRLYWTAEEDRAAYAGDLAGAFHLVDEGCRRRGRFKGNPVYHVAINWKEGERPTAEQARRACEHVMESLGFGEHQAAWAIHRDTDNDHVHLVINRVHPTRLVAVSPPFKKDYFILDRCMRELELEFGHGRANGPFVTLDTQVGPKIVRMSRTERLERGLLRADARPRLTRGAAAAEVRLGADSFQAWVVGTPAADMKGAVEAPGANWQSVHAALARHGVRIERKGSGMVVTTRLEDGRVLAAKASQMGRWASKGALEHALGPFEARQGGLPEAEPTAAAPAAYAAAVKAQRVAERGARGALGVGGERNPADRARRRAERAAAREALAARFRVEEDELRVARPAARQGLRERQAAERQALTVAQRRERAVIRADARRRGHDANIALSLWAYQAAAQREEMQKRQAAERKALTARTPRAEVWREWLERQAAEGDEAAAAALRGIRYREQRAAKRSRDGLEGEELDPLRRLTVATLTAEVDRRRQRVTYRDAHGRERFTDTGPRIEMVDKSDDSLEAALRIAAQKYGGKVEITGSAEFRERAARRAARMGIGVVDGDLQVIVRDERERLGGRGGDAGAGAGEKPSLGRGGRKPRGRGDKGSGL